MPLSTAASEGSMSFFTDLLAGNVASLISIADVAKVVTTSPQCDAPLPDFTHTLKHLEDCATSGLLLVADSIKVQTGGTRPEHISKLHRHDPRRGVWEESEVTTGATYSQPTYTTTLMIARDDFAAFLETPAGQHLPGRENSKGIPLWLGRLVQSNSAPSSTNQNDENRLISKQPALELISAGWPGHENVLDHPGAHQWLQVARVNNKGEYQRLALLHAFADHFGKPSDQSASDTLQEIITLLNTPRPA